MGRKNNVNPNHYKTDGREKPGQDIHHEVNKQKFAQAMNNEQKGDFLPGQSAEQATETPASENKTETGQANESANSSK